MLQTAIEAARGAGRIIAGLYPGERSLTFKGFRDLVSDADMASESLILDLIRKRFPDHGILSEEAGAIAMGSGFTWVVDPLDGTTNYAHRHPAFAVSIGVLEGEEPLIGVIHEPLRDQTFVAQKGAGASLNGVAIHTSSIIELKNALVGVDWGHENEVREQMLDYLHKILPRCGSLRALGSAALGLAYVAAGWLDAYFQPRLRPWDTAAGILLVKEAGGRCTTMKGEPYRIQLPECIATNHLIHHELIWAINGDDE